MARIFTAAPGLVKLMDGMSWANTQLPDVYQITPARIERLKQVSQIAPSRIQQPKQPEL
jgi:hypothetical protein